LKCGLLKVIGTKLVAEKLSGRAAPAFDGAVYDPEGLTAMSTGCRSALFELLDVHEHPTPPDKLVKQIPVIVDQQLRFKFEVSRQR
jgi:hypothetical protein